MYKVSSIVICLLATLSSAYCEHFNPTKGYEGNAEQVADQIVGEMKEGKRTNWGVSVRHKDWNKEVNSLEKSLNKAYERGDLDAAAIIDRKIQRRLGFIADKNSGREDSVQRVMKGALEEKRDEEAFYRARGMNKIADNIAKDIRTLEVDREVSKKWKQHIEEKGEQAERERELSKERKAAEWAEWDKESAKRMEEIRKKWSKEAAARQKLQDRKNEERARDFNARARAYTERLKKKNAMKQKYSRSQQSSRFSQPSMMGKRNLGKAKFGGYTYGNSASKFDKKTFGQERKFGQNKTFGQSNRFGQSKTFGQNRSFGQHRKFGQKSSFRGTRSSGLRLRR